MIELSWLIWYYLMLVCVIDLIEYDLIGFNDGKSVILLY